MLTTVLYIVILIFSIVIHEVAHGYAADALGDQTARSLGRLTLNPLKHLDPVGSILVPLILVLSQTGMVFGWAKPVPFNLSNVRNKRWGGALIALAGPAANFALALVFGLLFRFGDVFSFSMMSLQIFSAITLVNIALMIFNLFPIPPLDGHHILFALLSDYRYREFKNFLTKNSPALLLLFVFFGFKFVEPVIAGLYMFITGV